MNSTSLLNFDWVRHKTFGPALFAGAFAGLMIACAASVTTRTQISVAIAGVIVLLVMKRFNDNKSIRVIYLTIAAFLSIDYFYWRTFNTLTYYDPISFACSIALYFAEMYGFVVYLLSIFVNIDPLDRPSAPLPADKSLWPTVDVMVPSYNEDAELLKVTIISALQMNYPKDRMTVWLLDDGGTDQRCNSADPERAASSKKRRKQLTALCEELGAKYMTREKNEHAKAGNINNCLHRSHGELVLILDADHAPTVDLLERSVGWFLRDPKMFLVQTPHFFVNPDPIEKNLQTFGSMPGENEMFYKVIQRGLDFWNAAFFCGSAAVLRKKYLMEIGGIAGDTITEDAETALTLHSKGYNSAYIARPMISGLSPETLGGFIGQRIRWAQGMVQIFLLKNPLLIPGLSLPQRLCYFSSCFFWFFAYARVVFMLAPLCFLLFGLKIYDSNFVDFAAYAMPHLLAVFLVSDYLFGKVRWSFVSELYELIQSAFTLPAILRVFLNPRAPTFNVTAKGETLTEDFISPLAKPFYFFLLLNLIAIGFGVFRLFAFSADRFPTSITMAWAGFNIFILLACMGALLERKQLRQTPRMPTDLGAKIVLDGKDYPAQITDLSIGGLSLTTDAVYESVLVKERELVFNVAFPASLVGQAFHMRIRNLRAEGGILTIGAQFDHKDLDEMKSKILLVNGSSDRWMEFQDSRERRLGVTRSALFLLQCGIRYSIRHFAHIMLASKGKSVKSYSPATQSSL